MAIHVYMYVQYLDTNFLNYFQDYFLESSNF